MGIFRIQGNSFNRTRYHKQCFDKGVGICVFTSLPVNYDRPRGAVFLSNMNMKKVSLDVWIQLIGMLGVLGGLVALVIELNQSQRLSQASAYQARNSEIQEAQRELALSEDFAEILQKFDSQGVDSLTLGERSRVVAWHSAMQWRMQGQFYQYQQGFLEEAALEQTLNDLASGIYQKWEELDLTERIQPFEWKQRIRDRLGQDQ